MHIHLDALGGIAGDMFVAAMLDAWPEWEGAVQENLRKAGLGADVRAQLRPHDDGVLTGHRFDVSKPDAPEPPHRHEPHGHGHRHEHGPSHGHAHVPHDHPHTPWRDLRAMLERSALSDAVKRVSLGIFLELAAAEAAVHGKDIDAVAFHEVGNWDSIADIVAAATLIDAVAAKSWSVGSLPLGRGSVNTAHGRLPVPAPATTILLRGFAFHDDGLAGERVTPTGAAILRYLKPASGVGPTPLALGRSGLGFGTKRFPGMSNVLRVLSFEDAAGAQDRVGVVQFEIDDQTGEELGLALDLIRSANGVIDVTQTPTFGKKGRMMSSIRVLTKPEAVESVCAECFRQTTTLGVRVHVEARAILTRRSVDTPAGLRVKIAERPGGATAKAEMDDARGRQESHKARAEMRRSAEAAALEAKSR